MKCIFVSCDHFQNFILIQQPNEHHSQTPYIIVAPFEYIIDVCYVGTTCFQRACRQKAEQDRRDKIENYDHKPFESSLFIDALWGY